MLKNCDNCKYDLFRLCGEEDKTPCDDCYNGNPPTKWEPGENYEPMTNADRIRSMTDEELADEFMTRLVLCQYCEYQNECENAEDVAAYKCREGIVRWLKHPAEGE